jgi:hypothetical protein
MTTIATTNFDSQPFVAICELADTPDINDKIRNVPIKPFSLSSLQQGARFLDVTNQVNRATLEAKASVDFKIRSFGGKELRFSKPKVHLAS